MLDERAKDLLEEVYAQQLDPSVYEVARESYRRLKLRRHTLEKAAEGLTVSLARQRFEAAGITVLEEGERHLTVTLGAGVRAMNPAVVELWFESGAVQITAWAKEGLIPQRTAQKALRLCAAALDIE